MKLRLFLILISFTFLTLNPVLYANDKKEKESAKPKLISEIIKEEDAVSDEGLMTVHLQKEKLYFEIPDSLFDVEMLLISRLEKVPPSFSGYMPSGRKTAQHIVYWQKKSDRILLRIRYYTSVSDEEDPINLSVQSNNFEPILASFPIKGHNASKDKFLIDVSSLFLTDIKAISGVNSRLRKQYKVGKMDAKRSLIESAKSFPINTEIKHILTYDMSEPPKDLYQAQTMSIQMNQSFILLPKEQMQKRLFDERVGWFTISQVDYSSDELGADQKRYLRKWNLIPKDIEAYQRGELVEPIKPIVYYIDPATPEKWRPFIKMGVEDWNSSFAKAGFKNAIVCLDPPDDPDFSPEDARYSVVRYIASKTRNAQGPSVSDPRTGEIIESDIIWYHNHLRSYRNRYMLETGAANPSARTLNTPQPEIGEMLRMVICHEIGHALGLPHNMKASSTYPIDSLRSAHFTQKNGIASSIMDYARYNYVAQPGDEGVRFIRKLGPYDDYSIEYGYRYYHNRNTVSEKVDLNAFIKANNDNPYAPFGSGYGGYDPASQTEAVGDDNLKASHLGLQNLQYVAKNLIQWTSAPDENYADLKELHGELLSCYSRYIRHIITNIGGVHETLKTSSDEGDVYKPVSGIKQSTTLYPLEQWLFNPQYWLVPEEITSKIMVKSRFEVLAKWQSGLINRILDPARLNRLSTQQLDGGFSASYLLSNITRSLFADLPARQSQLDPVRRIMQRKYIDQIGALLNAEVKKGQAHVKDSDAGIILKQELRALKKTIPRGYKQNPLFAAHYDDLLDRIDKILDIKEVK